MSPKNKTLLFLLVFFLGFFGLYLNNLSRGVYGGDVGDFVTAAKVMGVPHPPGYPLFTFLGFILTRINMISPAFMVGMIASFSSALSVVLFYLISLKLTKNKFASFISSLILGFNYIFWFYAEIAEVFSLNALFVLSLLFVALLYREKKDIKYFFLLCFIGGLSLTNHQTVVLIFPSILILIYDNLFKLISKPKELLKGFLLVLLGFSVYLYVPIASSHNPPVNWDNVKDLESFIRLFLRQDYGTFSAGAFAPPIFVERIAILKNYTLDLITQLTLPVLLLVVLGLISSFLKNKRVFFALLLGFIISGPLFVTYAGFPLTNFFLIGVNERFFLMSSVIVLLFVPFGILYFANLFSVLFKKKTFEKLFIGIFLIIPLSLFFYNFPKTNLSKITIGDDLAYDYLSPLPKNSVLVIGGDTPLLNTWYVHYGLNFRPDVNIINLNALRAESFYEKEREKYLKENPKDASNQNLRLKVFENIALSRPLYSSDPIKPNGKFDDIKWVPYGLTHKLFLPSEKIPTEEEFTKTTGKIWGELRYFKNLRNQASELALGSLTISDIQSYYANALLLTGNFVLTNYKNGDFALSFFKSVLNTDPNYYKGYETIGIYYLGSKNCALAKDNLKKSIEIYPVERTAYYFLYLSYVCLKDRPSQDEIAKRYKSVFGADFYADFAKSTKK